jgi:hypothetical protein
MNMSRCEDVKMRRCEDEREIQTPLLEEPTRRLKQKYLFAEMKCAFLNFLALPGEYGFLN